MLLNRGRRKKTEHLCGRRSDRSRQPRRRWAGVVASLIFWKERAGPAAERYGHPRSACGGLRRAKARAATTSAGTSALAKQVPAYSCPARMTHIQGALLRLLARRATASASGTLGKASEVNSMTLLGTPSRGSGGGGEKLARAAGLPLSTGCLRAALVSCPWHLPPRRGCSQRTQSAARRARHPSKRLSPFWPFWPNACEQHARYAQGQQEEFPSSCVGRDHGRPGCGAGLAPVQCAAPSAESPALATQQLTVHSGPQACQPGIETGKGVSSKMPNKPLERRRADRKSRPPCLKGRRFPKRCATTHAIEPGSVGG